MAVEPTLLFAAMAGERARNLATAEGLIDLTASDKVNEPYDCKTMSIWQCASLLAATLKL